MATQYSEAKLAEVRASITEAAIEVERLTEIAQREREDTTDMAIVSGLRRKQNARADARQWAKNQRYADAWQAVRYAEFRLDVLRNQEKRLLSLKPLPFTDEQLRAATHVRDGFGWHKVVRVSAKSVTVRTEWSWDERIPRSRVLEVRS